MIALISVAAVGTVAFFLGRKTDAPEESESVAPLIAASSPSPSSGALTTLVETTAASTTTLDVWAEDDMYLSTEEYRLTRDVLISQGFDPTLIGLPPEDFADAAADLCGQLELSASFEIGMARYQSFVSDVARGSGAPVEEQKAFVDAVLYFATSLCGGLIPD